MGKCLLDMTPADSGGKCYNGECVMKQCGWDSDEAARRKAYIQTHGLTKCADGLYRLVMKNNEDK